jgi:uncharacterized protein (TIGR02266 family)
MHNDDRASHPELEAVLPLVRERRSRPRVAIAIEVSLTSESHFYAGLTGDVSGGGVFVSTYEPHPMGSRVDIELALPEGPVRARGVVRWVREMANGVAPGLGIAFEHLSDDDQSAIERFCEERAPIYYDVEDALS